MIHVVSRPSRLRLTETASQPFVYVAEESNIEIVTDI
jgi:hypothetical protein